MRELLQNAKSSHNGVFGFCLSLTLHSAVTARGGNTWQRNSLHSPRN